MDNSINSILPPLDPGTNLSYSWRGSVLERFQGHVLSQPDATCAVSKEEILTYSELDAASEELAELVEESLHATKRSSVLSIYGDRTPRLAVALLAAIKLGRAFQIIDPTYPFRRIGDCLKYVNPAAILNASRDAEAKELFQDFLPPNGSAAWLETNVPPGRSGVNAFCCAPSLSAHSLMYVALTSGTTGIPKAVWGTHGPVSHFFHWQCETFNVVPADRVSVLSGLAHDPLLRDVLMPLWAGCSAWFPPPDVYRVPGLLYAWLREVQITVIHLTPSLCNLLLHIPQTEGAPCLSEVRLAFFGGESLTVKQVKRFQALAPNAVVINCYGSTETPQVMSAWRIEPQYFSQSVSKIEEQLHIPIGRGIEGVQLLLLTKDYRLCGIGESGEICIRTPYRAARVEDLAGRAADNLITNPFASNPSDLVYRTGDYGRYLADGAVMLLGRHDRQVKVRGFRVDLSEIEYALERCHGLAQYFIDIEPRGDEHALALFVVPECDAEFNVDKLRSELLEWVPSFMVPERTLCLASLPHTPNGKVDREALRKMWEKKSEVKEDITPVPLVGDEATKVALIQERLERMSIADENGNILPADSLRSVEIACLIENEFKVKVSVGDFLGNRTLAILAARIDSLQKAPVSLRREPVIIQDASEKLRKNPPWFPSHEHFGRGLVNRVLQLLARIAPDALRVRLHRWRGVQLGYNVSIGYDTIIETGFPRLVRIGNHTNIGMRVTIIGHFRGMGHVAANMPTVTVEDYAFIGPGTIILPNVAIGEGSVVAAGSVVSTSIPSYCFAQGNPARVVAKCGVPLSGSATYAEFLNRLIPLAHDETAINAQPQSRNSF